MDNFNLIPWDPESYLIAADWHEEQGFLIPNAIRDKILPLDMENGNGIGVKYSSRNYPQGYGDGWGLGSGDGNGLGMGLGMGYGFIADITTGSGYGSGQGYGQGYGTSYG